MFDDASRWREGGRSAFSLFLLYFSFFPPPLFLPPCGQETEEEEERARRRQTPKHDLILGMGGLLVGGNAPDRIPYLRIVQNALSAKGGRRGG